MTPHKMLERMAEALRCYVDEEKLVEPSSWNSFKMGGGPTLEDYETEYIGGEASSALDDYEEWLKSNPAPNEQA